MNFPASRIALFSLATLPFALLPLASAWSVTPLAQMGARWCNLVIDGLPLGSHSESVAAASEGSANVEPIASPNDAPTPLVREPNTGSSGYRPRSERETPPSSGSMTTRRAVSARRARPNVFVGPDSIQRAIPVAGRPTSSWTNGTAEHPAGLLIQSPGALAGVIEPGDILVEAEGQAVRSFEDLLVTVKQAYERRVKRLSGRLFRRGDLVPVTVEPGW
ncbi:MAG TPA: hypothetical protein VK550_32310 [Polyangiaceae bacterium]|nr:hypothetical protein [Polyangiaceae bacterium]